MANFQENELIRHEVRPDGIKEIRWVEGRPVAVEPPKEEMMPLPKKFRDKHLAALQGIYHLGEQIVISERIVPLLHEEALKLTTKGVLKDLCDWGLLGSMMTELSRESKKLGGRKLYYVTPQGKAIVETIETATQEKLEEIPAQSGDAAQD